MLPLRDNVPTRAFPVVTVGLIVANLAVWLWELGGTPWEQDVLRDGFYPCSLPGPCVGVAAVHHLPWYEGAFTGMFLHAGWEHVLGNMLFLWIFGNNVEDALGRVRFLVWYLAAGLAAIALVLGAYFVLLPNARVLTWILFVLREIPAGIFLGLWFLYQFLLGNMAI